MKSFRHLLFPTSLAIILGVLSAWLGRISEIVVEEVKLNPHQPQYQMTLMQGKRFDVSGNLKQQLDASLAWQLPDQKNVFLQQPRLQTFAAQQPQYQVESALARYEIASKKVFFKQDVQLHKTADEHHPNAQVTTRALTVDTTREVAQTNEPVYYQYGHSKGSSRGMIYDNKNGLLQLPSQVKAIIYDPKNS